MTFALAMALQEIVFEKNVVYGKGAGEELTLNLARPAAEGTKRPCVLVIHGGGWAGGNKEMHNTLAQDFAKRGYVSATVGYRLAPKHRFPAQVEDVKCAVRFLRANAAAYGLDAERVGATGFSAGAHLSMMLGVMGKEDGLEGDGGNAELSSQVNAVVSFFGPTDLLATDIGEQSKKILKEFIGGTSAEKPDEYKRASPITYLTNGDAPMLLIQGTKDPLVPHTQATVLIDAMTRERVKGRLDLIAGAGHGWLEPELGRTLNAMYEYFAQTLKVK